LFIQENTLETKQMNRLFIWSKNNINNL
jgi:hypothetical protein